VDDALQLRLRLGSHLAKHLREALHSQKGYTCTVGISTNKVLSKLVGNLHKPCNQTTLLPPYTPDHDAIPDNVTSFMDDHEVGKVPGIGFKLAQKLRAHVLQRQPELDESLVYGGTKETVTVKDVRTYPGMSAEALERILGGPGMPHGVGAKTWDLLNGCDESEVSQARTVPTQISLEDSYSRLESMSEVVGELRTLAKSLIRRMHIDLLEDDEAPLIDNTTTNFAKKRWLAFPKTIRLTTRPRPPQNPNGTRNRALARISRSGPMPNFIFNLNESVDSLAERLAMEILIPLFRKLHPEKSGWNLSLINIAAANMVEGSSDKGGVGRDIAKMFARQDDVLKEFRVQEESEGIKTEDKGFDDDPHSYSVPTGIQQDDRKSNLASWPTASSRQDGHLHIPDELVEVHKEDTTLAQRAASPLQQKFGSEDIPTRSQEHSAWNEDTWASDEEMVDDDTFKCDACGAVMPIFAVAAHSRWHEQS
jgi:DNA polymerase iota